MTDGEETKATEAVVPDLVDPQPQPQGILDWVGTTLGIDLNFGSAMGNTGDVWEYARQTFALGTKEVTNGVDQSAAWAADALKQARRELQGLETQATQVMQENLAFAKVLGDTYTEYETKGIETLRTGITTITRSYPDATLFGGTVLAFLAFPATRRFAVRHTIGRFRSAEGRYKSATRRKEEVRQQVDLHLQDTKKLLERTKLAQEDFVKTQKKLKDARNQLDSLQSRLHKTDQKVWQLLDDLSLIKTKDALALRSEVLINKNVIQKQSKLVKKAIKNIAATAGF